MTKSRWHPYCRSRGPLSSIWSNGSDRGDPDRGAEAIVRHGCGGTPQNLNGFIVNPQAADPKTAMPIPGITEAEARDVVAYLRD
ncbi:MAG: c-type cytochrome [Devosia sp.]